MHPKAIYWALLVALLAVTLVVITLSGTPLKQALILAPFWTVFALCIIVGSLNFFAPGPAIRWYDWVTSRDEGFSYAVRETFSAWLGTDVEEAWRDKTARCNIRLIGLVLITLSIPYAFVMAWWSRWLLEITN